MINVVFSIVSVIFNMLLIAGDTPELIFFSRKEADTGVVNHCLALDYLIRAKNVLS